MSEIKRRSFLAGGGATAVAALTACKSPSPGTAPIDVENNTSSKTFVLVHGAWHGGWCWRDVRNILEDKGHRVFTPTMTGLGERSHLLSPDIGLETHIQDMVNHIEFEGLTDIILVGHSYGGMVITGVVDRLKDRISHIVYLDAAVPDDGENFASQAPDATPEIVKAIEDGFRSLSQDGVVMDVFPAQVLGIPETDTDAIQWVSSHMTPHPLKTWLDPITLQHEGSKGVDRTYIHCVKPVLQQASFASHYAGLKSDKSWTTLTMDTGHDAMVTEPNALSIILLNL